MDAWVSKGMTIEAGAFSRFVRTRHHLAWRCLDRYILPYRHSRERWLCSTSAKPNIL